MGTSANRGAGAASTPDEKTADEKPADETAAQTELEQIAAMNTEDIEALAGLSDTERAELAELATAGTSDGTAKDEQPAVEGKTVSTETVPEQKRVTIPGQPGHPPLPNAGNPQIATN